MLQETKGKPDYGSTTTTTLKHPNDNKNNRLCECDPDHIHLHCAAISGILPEYGNTVGDSLIVPYLLELGAPTWSTSYVWIITPFIDSWMQPIYGKLSDKYTKKQNSCFKLGGRKPFIILFGIFATIGLIVIPQARIIKKFGHIALAVIICILSYTLMDMSHGDLLIPTRALLNDLCNNSKLIKYGNEKFTFYQAIGRCLGYLVVSINWKALIDDNSSTKLKQFLKKLQLDHHVSICFTLSIFILWIIILFVMFGTPNQIKRLFVFNTNNHKKRIMQYNNNYKKNKGNNNYASNEMLITPSGRVVILHPTVLITDTITSILSSDRQLSINCDYDFTTDDDDDDDAQLSSFQLSPMSDHDPLSPVKELEESQDNDRNKEDHHQQQQQETQVQHEEIWKFPLHFKLLWIIQFLGWGNFAAFSLYFTSFVAIDIYSGEPNKTNSMQFDNFERGIRSATSILLISSIIAAISGKFIIPFLNNKIGVKLVFFSGELLLNILLVLLLFGKSSIIFIAIIISFYGIAIQIHYNNVFIIIERDLRELFKSEHRRAYVLSIFNLSILFANVLVSLFAGWIVHLMNNQFVWGISMFAIIALFFDIIVYIIFFVTQHHHMFDTKYQNTPIPNNIIIAK